MQVIILVVTIIVLGSFAFSQPKQGESFSPKRQKLNKACIYALLGIGVFSVAFMLYSTFFGNKCGDYDMNTQVYALEMKTSGHRLLGFMETLETKTLFGDEASEIMEDLFGDTTEASMLKWNSTPDWAGKYTVKVFYTEEEYELYKNNQAPKTMQRNNLEDGTVYRFTLCEDGHAYCSMSGQSEKPIYKGSLSWKNRRKLFPW